MTRLILITLIVWLFPIKIFSQSFETVFEDSEIPFLSSISFTDSNSGWAVGWGGTILKYNGDKWVKYKSPTRNSLNKVYFSNSGIGWIVGDYGTLLNFNNGQWEVFDLETNESLNDIFFIDNHGYLVGTNGFMSHFHNGSWKRFDAKTKQHLYSIQVLNDKTGFLLGWNQTLIRINGDSLEPITQDKILGMDNPFYYFYSSEFTKEEDWYFFGMNVVQYKKKHFEVLENKIPPIRNTKKVGNDIWLNCSSSIYVMRNNQITKIEDNYYQDFKSICFSDNETGWIVAEGGLIIKFKK